jgi:hypothetical protein
VPTSEVDSRRDVSSKEDFTPSGLLAKVERGIEEVEDTLFEFKEQIKIKVTAEKKDDLCARLNTIDDIVQSCLEKVYEL